MLILEAEVDVRGYVKAVKVLRGHPLFDEAATDAVKQWRYQPLLLNGEPTGFVLTVTMQLQPAAALRLARVVQGSARRDGHPAGALLFGRTH